MLINFLFARNQPPYGRVGSVSAG